MNTIKIDHPNTLMVAHRGASGLEKENTTLSFVAACNRSYWGIETDIHKTADGKFIVIHDDNAKRVSGVDIDVEKADYEALRAIRLTDIDGSTDRRDILMPSLSEYIRICKKYEKICVLEIKNQMERADIAEVIREIEAEGYLDHVVFISFYPGNLFYLRELRPEQPAQFLINELIPEIREGVIKYHFNVDVNHKILTEELIKEWHDAGLKVNCWTVNDPAVAERLISWGVDFITSNILE